MAEKHDWRALGFASQPQHKVVPKEGLLAYRAWGAGSSEWGSGFFSLSKPTSVLDAELRFNIADWGNGVHFVSTFQLKPGTAYQVGPVAHGAHDLSLPGMQLYVEPPVQTKVLLLVSREVLRHDVTVSQRGGNA